MGQQAVPFPCIHDEGVGLLSGRDAGISRFGQKQRSVIHAGIAHLRATHRLQLAPPSSKLRSSGAPKRLMAAGYCSREKSYYALDKVARCRT